MAELGGYELIERLAEGGMAEVWKARARGAAGFEKLVVVKRLLHSMTDRPGLGELLVREAKIVARLSHPNIVQVFELGEDRGTYFIAMEYVHGRDLGQIVQHRQAPDALGLHARLWIVSEVAKALDHAHQRRSDDGRPLLIVHRDVSPQNVIVSFDGAVKVTDFGIARADDVELGRSEDPTQIRGKYAYMSPEQAHGRPLDRRSDIFSLGIVLYELLTGRRLFRGRTSQETLTLVRNAELPPLDATTLGVDERLAAIVARALAVDVEHRYPWAADLHRELMRYLVSSGAFIGEADVRDAMRALFPRESAVQPNKLQVDLMLRAYDDSVGGSTGAAVVRVPAHPDELRTQTLPAGKTSRKEERRCAAISFATPVDERHALAVHALASKARASAVVSDGDTTYVAFADATSLAAGLITAARTALAFEQEVGLESMRIDSLDVVVREAMVSLVSGFDDPCPIEPGIRVTAGLRRVLDTQFRFDRRDDDRLVQERGRAERELRALRAETALIGRRKEIERAVELFDDASRGAGRILHVFGPPGMGRTRFVSELRALAQHGDVPVFVARAEPARRRLGLVIDLIADVAGIDTLDSVETRRMKVQRLRVLGLGEVDVAAIGEMVGVHSWERAPKSTLPAIEHARVVAKMLRGVCEDSAAVVIVEDVHLIDEESGEVLALLRRAIPTMRCLLVTTGRTAVDEPHWSSHGIALAPLSAEHAVELYRTLRPTRPRWPVDARWLMDWTGGVPYWIRAVARRNDDELAPLDDETLPAMRQELDLLRPRARRVLLALSCARGVSSVADLIAAVGGERGSSLLTLANLARAGWVDVRAADGRSIDASDWTRWGTSTSAEAIATAALRPLALRAHFEATLPPADATRLHDRFTAEIERRDPSTAPECMALGEHVARSSSPFRSMPIFERAFELALSSRDHAVAVHSATALFTRATVESHRRTPSGTIRAATTHPPPRPGSAPPAPLPTFGVLPPHGPERWLIAGAAAAFRADSAMWLRGLVEASRRAEVDERLRIAATAQSAFLEERLELVELSAESAVGSDATVGILGALAQLDLGSLAHARSLLTSVAIERDVHDQALASSVVSELAMRDGEDERAEAAAAEALTLAVAVSDATFRSYALASAAFARLARGRTVDAMESLLEAIASHDDELVPRGVRRRWALFTLLIGGLHAYDEGDFTLLDHAISRVGDLHVGHHLEGVVEFASASRVVAPSLSDLGRAREVAGPSRLVDLALIVIAAAAVGPREGPGEELRRVVIDHASHAAWPALVRYFA